MEQAIVRFVNEELLGGNGPPVTADDEIVLDGTVDSLGVTRLVDFIESEFKLSVPARDVTIDNFRTITTMADYVRAQRESAATP